jgi:spore coat polysaccharide biosynthesis predicted glycosyltransferase SpsG
LGHLSRLLALAETLIDDGLVIPEFLIFGDIVKETQLKKFDVYNFKVDSNIEVSINHILNNNRYEVLVFDLYPKFNLLELQNLLIKLKKRKIYLVSIDALVEYHKILDLVWIPSINFIREKKFDDKHKIISGWDSFLIQKRLKQKSWMPGSKVLILSGAGDVSGIGETLPQELEDRLARNTEIHWVKGPFSRHPNIPKRNQLSWNIHNAPDQLDELIIQSNYVISVFGVSFFEVLQYGIPTVVFSPYGDKNNSELNILFKEGVSKVELNPKNAVNGLVDLMEDEDLSRNYSDNALKKMSVNGVQKLCNRIYSLLRLL